MPSSDPSAGTNVAEDQRLHFTQTLELTLREVRDGYLTGRTTLFSTGFDVEAFRCKPGTWNEPDGKRARRHVDVLEGLQVDDVVLHQVEIPGFEGEWIVFLYPGENEHFTGDST